jgi:hypothetical protein
LPSRPRRVIRLLEEPDSDNPSIGKYADKVVGSRENETVSHEYT